MYNMDVPENRRFERLAHTYTNITMLSPRTQPRKKKVGDSANKTTLVPSVTNKAEATIHQKIYHLPTEL